MAGFGGEYARFAKFATEESSAAAPTYDAPVSLGPLVSGNLTVTNASGEQYGDNILQEKVDKFASGAIPMEVTDCPKASIAEVYGATYNEEQNEVEFGSDDEAPYGALAYIKNILRKGTEIFEANFYPKAQAARTIDNTQTRSGSITFQNSTINWTIMDPIHKTTKWQYAAEFDTYDEAVTYIEGKLGVIYLTGGTAAAETSGLAGEDLTATPTWNDEENAPTTGITYQWQYLNVGVWEDLTDSYTGHNTATLTTVEAQDEDVKFRCAITYNGITVYTNEVQMS